MSERYEVECHGTTHGGICCQCRDERLAVIIVDNSFVDKTSIPRKASVVVVCDRCAAKLAVAILEATGR